MILYFKPSRLAVILEDTASHAGGATIVFTRTSPGKVRVTSLVGDRGLGDPEQSGGGERVSR